VYTIKLMDIQVFDSNYSRAADDNVVSRITKYPLRGMILDRSGKELVRNRPVFDLMVIPKELVIPNDDTLAFANFFEVDTAFVHEKLAAAEAYADHLPSVFIKHLSAEDYAKIQDRLTFYPGIFASERTVRDYPHNSLANSLGYVKEVDKRFLERDTTDYYKQGDLVGKSGLEKEYEKELRGIRGVSYVVRNVRGVIKGKFQDGRFDTIPGVGKNLITGIDLTLQQYGERLMQQKRGAVVAIEPKTGEILSIISFPSYNPNLLTGEGKEASQNYIRLVNDPDKPLFNRAIQAVYPPGSTFKALMAMIGLQDGVLDTITTFHSCDQRIVGCHGHVSPLNVMESLRHSCNPWYVKALRKIILQDREADEIADTRLGLEKWGEQLHQFGLGKKLHIDLPFERPGLIPTPSYYDKFYYLKNWKVSNIYSIGIGQGEVLTTPLQLANVAATIANRGWFYQPHLVKRIGEDPIEYPKHEVGVAPAYIDFVARSMSNIYTASRAKIPGITICGKTGTAQNPHGEDHSVFMAFAPLEDPKIAIAVYVENAGFGGSWAGPLASLMVEKYLRGEIDPRRKWVEDYVLSGDFIEEEEEEEET